MRNTGCYDNSGIIKLKERLKTMSNENEKNKEIKAQKKAFTPPPGKNPKPFDQFSNPKKFSTNPQSSFNAFHRRLNTRRSSGGK